MPLFDYSVLASTQIARITISNRYLMPLFDYSVLAFTQIALLILSGIWLLRRNDEVPLLISSFLLYVASYRYWVVTSGTAKWVSLSNFGFSAITNHAALVALSYIVLGQILLLATYMLRQRKVLPIVVPACDQFLLQWLRPKVLLLGMFCLPLVVATRSSVAAQSSAGLSLAFQVSSYLFLFPLALVGVGILILCLWKFGGFSLLPSRIAAILILISVAYSTYNSQLRFLFLGYIIGGGVILSASYRPKTRLVILTSCALLGISMFALAGAMRDSGLASDALNQAAWERAFNAEDGNMLDGFVLLQRIYPRYLDFSWGMEHLEILMRPIPRALWPDKPVGGYMLKLGIIKADTGFTIGISPTLFGSFYAEGGIVGIFCFSLLYGEILATVVRRSTQFHPLASILIRAILCAFLIPLLRGGDLPGIYAWLGMAFWPCFLFLWIKRAYFQQKLPSTFLLYPPTEIPLTREPYQ